VAVATDRDLATKLAPFLSGLPPLKTFLSFAKAGVFPELVDRCIREMPANDWILLPGDGEIIDSLPESALLDIWKSVVSQGLAGFTQEIPKQSHWQPAEGQFSLQPVKMSEISEGIHHMCLHR
jgi:hypothetical protein